MENPFDTIGDHHFEHELKKAIDDNLKVALTWENQEWISGLSKMIRQKTGYQMNMGKICNILTQAIPLLVYLLNNFVKDEEAFLEMDREVLLSTALNVLRFTMDQVTFVSNVHALITNDKFEHVPFPADGARFQQATTLWTESYMKLAMIENVKLGETIERLNGKLAAKKGGETPNKEKEVQVPQAPEVPGNTPRTGVEDRETDETDETDEIQKRTDDIQNEMRKMLFGENALPVEKCDAYDEYDTPMNNDE